MSLQLNLLFKEKRLPGNLQAGGFQHPSNKPGITRHAFGQAAQIGSEGHMHLRVLVFLVAAFIFNGCAPDADQSNDSPVKPSNFNLRAHPGIEEVDAQLAAKFKAMHTKKGAAYTPRTKHLDENGWAHYTNRLFLESNPYLLQHAHNPVNWYPWGDEAFETAQRKNLPVLLSIGYSTCHWCHVMEEESFEDLEIAAYINTNYIAVKVDREERPDVDAIYMSAVQAITGRGGWPMTVWLTPDRNPFYGGTYFPARDGDRGATVGFLTLLQKIKAGYDQRPEVIRQAGAQLTDVIQSMLTPAQGGAPPLEPVLHKAIAHLKTRFDKENGGVIGAPKFPSTMPVRLLLRYYRRTGDQDVLHMAERTLLKMASGGIYDQAGGGFHRYATDKKWLVPHFEKMLYDNALLVMAYLDGYQITGNPIFKQVATETLVYIQRDMTSPEGGFYTATDADSLTPAGETKEGYYFTWTPSELESVLGKKDAAVAARYFDVTESGNFEGRNILNLKSAPADVAAQLGISPRELSATIAKVKPKLYEHRNRRTLPLRDEKVLSAWNGLMISAFAKAGLLLDKPEYIQTAGKAAAFIMQRLYTDNRLLRSYVNGEVSGKAYLDDYAFFIAALLDLFEADPDPTWIDTAIAIEKILSGHYLDHAAGGYFMTADNHENLIAREKPGYDGALPSGNAVAAMNLLRLSEFTTDDSYRQKAVKTMAAFAAIFESNPLVLTEMLAALEFSLDNAKELVIVSPRGKTQASKPFLSRLRSTYLPNRALIQVEMGKHARELAATLPIVKGKTANGDQPVAYVCEKGVCLLPSVTPENFAEQIAPVKMMATES